MCFVAWIFSCIWFADQLLKDMYSKEEAERQEWKMQNPDVNYSRFQPVIEKRKAVLLYLVLQRACTLHRHVLNVVVYLTSLWGRPLLWSQ